MIVDRRRRPRAPKLAAMLLVIAGVGWLDAQAAANADWRQLAPWCAYLGGFDGGYDCSYYTFEQCMATARGLGNSCMPNPRAQFDSGKPSRRTYKTYK
jgi:hypothetical protein